MPLFQTTGGEKAPISALEEDTDSDSDSEEEELSTKELKKRHKEETQKIMQLQSPNPTKMKHPIIVDSGAAESVIPIGWCPQAKVEAGPNKGKTYAAANGNSIKNKGEQVITMFTREGQTKHMKFQVCEVTRPLASVYKICEAGHSVIFNPSWDKRGCYVLNHENWEKTMMKAHEGVYVMETLVAPTSQQKTPRFTRQGS